MPPSITLVSEFHHMSYGLNEFNVNLTIVLVYVQINHTYIHAFWVQMCPAVRIKWTTPLISSIIQLNYPANKLSS